MISIEYFLQKLSIYASDQLILCRNWFKFAIWVFQTPFCVHFCNTVIDRHICKKYISKKWIATKLACPPPLHILFRHMKSTSLLVPNFFKKSVIREPWKTYKDFDLFHLASNVQPGTVQTFFLLEISFEDTVNQAQQFILFLRQELNDQHNGTLSFNYDWIMN